MTKTWPASRTTSWAMPLSRIFLQKFVVGEARLPRRGVEARVQPRVAPGHGRPERGPFLALQDKDRVRRRVEVEGRLDARRRHPEGRPPGEVAEGSGVVEVFEWYGRVDSLLTVHGVLRRHFRPRVGRREGRSRHFRRRGRRGEEVNHLFGVGDGLRELRLQLRKARRRRRPPRGSRRRRVHHYGFSLLGRPGNRLVHERPRAE
mmetsp:Transcript_30800/g.99292  ORF Transcript_30800/g.99292 Transcript_30800/m.99292 type:complete len:204 (+) Transcript_30800:1-612(+)